MKSPTHRYSFLAVILLLVTACLRAAPATPAATPAPAVTAAATSLAVPKAADRFERTKQHIDALLKRRLNPEPLPAVLPNPFQLSDDTPTVNSTRTPPGPPSDQSTTVATIKVDPPADYLPPGSDEELLARYLPTLRVTGTGQLNGRAYVVINSSPYREGDVIIINNKTQKLYFQVLHIAPGEITIGYNDATQVLKFKN
jgi:hypothetical protein